MIPIPRITIDCANALNGCQSQIEFELEKAFNGVFWSDANLSDFLTANGWKQNDQGEWRCPNCRGEK